MPDSKKLVTVKIVREYQFPHGMLKPEPYTENDAKHKAWVEFSRDFQEEVAHNMRDGNFRVTGGFFTQEYSKEAPFRLRAPLLKDNAKMRKPMLRCKTAAEIMAKSKLEDEMGKLDPEISPNLYSNRMIEVDRDKEGNPVMMPHGPKFLRREVEHRLRAYTEHFYELLSQHAE